MHCKFATYEGKEVVIACEHCPVCGEYAEVIIGERDHNIERRGTVDEQLEESEFTNTLLKGVDCGH